MEQHKHPQLASNPLQLSVCVIGRNEGKHLPACAESLRKLDVLGISYETLFIDSASTDGSSDIAVKDFDNVLCLAPSTNLNAGAARHIGSLQARGDWILYMDGDMELAPEILTAIDDLIGSGRLDDGLCGFTENVYPDGGRDLIRFRGNREGANCRIFGGAVLLPRLKVLEAGNWSCALYAYEEAELYSRLLRLGVDVVWYDRRMVVHKTPRIPSWRKLFGYTIPYRSILGKKFYGVGQVTRLTLRNGNFFCFARLMPEAYLMLGSELIAIFIVPWLYWQAALVPAVVFGVNALRLALRSAISYTFWLPQLVFGVWRLHPDFRPTIEQVCGRYDLTEVTRNRVS
jgi:glycosyltransferase involved in cell wall biosynthesis